MLIVIFIAIFVLLYIVADGKKIIHAKTIVNKDNSHSFLVVVTIINVLFLIVTTLLLWLSAAFSPLTGEEFYRYNALRLLYFSQNALLWLIYIEYKRTANTLYPKYFLSIVCSVLLFTVFGLPFSALVNALILVGLIIVQMLLYRISINKYPL